MKILSQTKLSPMLIIETQNVKASAKHFRLDHRIDQAVYKLRRGR